MHCHKNNEKGKMGRQKVISICLCSDRLFFFKSSISWHAMCGSTEAALVSQEVFKKKQAVQKTSWILPSPLSIESALEICVA